MDDPLFGILVVLLALVGAVAGVTCLHALNAEREPGHDRVPRSGSPVPH